MIIDIHAHISNHKLWGLHTDYARIIDLEREAKKHDVRKIFLMATYFPYKNSGLKNEVLLERIKDNDFFGMFASLNVEADIKNAIGDIRKLAENKLIVGLKLYPGYQRFRLSDEKLNMFYKLAEEFNLPVAIHTGYLHHCCSKRDRGKTKKRCGSVCLIDKYSYLAKPKEAEPVVKKYDGVNFILAHLGNPYFDETRELIAKYPNVYTDMSGLFMSGTHEDTREYRKIMNGEMLKFLEIKGGVDRFMFASDYPILSHKDAIELIEALKPSEDEKRKIYFENAVNLFNLNMN